MKTIELTDEIRDEEPVGWLVFCADTTVYEYRLFPDESDAELFASEQIESSGKATWPIYPLYASHAKEVLE